mgnify:CR=1 FL=1
MKSKSRLSKNVEVRETMLVDEIKPNSKVDDLVIENETKIESSTNEEMSIQSDLRSLGFSVQELITSIPGTPNLLVGVMNLNYLAEVNMDSEMTNEQKAWQRSWTGQSSSYTNTKEVIQAISNYSQEMKRKLDAVRDFCEMAIALYDKKQK